MTVCVYISACVCACMQSGPMRPYRREHIFERERSECSKASGRATVDCELILVRETPAYELLCARTYIIDVGDTPGASKSASIFSSISCRATVVDIQHREAPTRPELNARIEGCARACSGPAVSLHKQRRRSRRISRKCIIFRRIVVAIRLAERRREGDRRWRRYIRC